MHWLFLGFLSFFPVASPPHSVLEGCADPSGSLNKQELRAGCHHPCSFSAHSCWGTIHQANRLEEAQELSELPMWNKSYYWMRPSHTHFFSTSLLGQSLQSFSMEWEVVGFSATFLMLRKLEMARNVRCGSAQALAGNASCRSVVHVLAGLGGHNQKFSAVIYKHLERKKKRFWLFITWGKPLLHYMWSPTWELRKCCHFFLVEVGFFLVEGYQSFCVVVVSVRRVQSWLKFWSPNL